MPTTRILCSTGVYFLVIGCFASRFAMAEWPVNSEQDVVKVAAVQISGYDKCDVPREGYDPARQSFLTSNGRVKTTLN